MSGDVGDGLVAAVAGVAGKFVATLVCGSVVFRTGMLAEGGHRDTVGGTGHNTGSWPKLRLLRTPIGSVRAGSRRWLPG